MQAQPALFPAECTHWTPCIPLFSGSLIAPSSRVSDGELLFIAVKTAIVVLTAIQIDQ